MPAASATEINRARESHDSSYIVRRHRATLGHGPCRHGKDKPSAVVRVENHVPFHAKESTDLDVDWCKFCGDQPGLGRFGLCGSRVGCSGTCLLL